jgi:predicted RNase H-like HicB family nuclease
MSMTPRTYTVTVTRAGDDWLAVIPGLPGFSELGSTFEELEDAVRAALAAGLSLSDEEQTELDLVWSVDGGIDGINTPLSQS